MVAACDASGLPIRIGLHTGEVELVGDDVRGIAVHVTARVLGAAGAGEVLITQTTADLVEGSGVTLEDAGEHELKGIPSARRLYRVMSTPG
jgi:class 3 adenylate cyclase